MKKKPEQNQLDSRFIIGIGGGHREYDIINTRYVGQDFIRHHGRHYQRRIYRFDHAEGRA